MVVKGRLLGTKCLKCGSIPVFKSKKKKKNWELTNPSLVTLWKDIEQQQKQEAKEGHHTLIMVARNEEEKFP